MQKFRYWLETIEHLVTPWLTQAHKYAPSYSVFSRLSDAAVTSHMAHKRGAVADEDLDMLSAWKPGGEEPEIPRSMYEHLLDPKGKENSPWLSDERRLASAEEDFRELIAEATWGRVFCVTEKGYIGLAPDNAEVGDEAVVFLGGGTPFVVRRVEREERYRVLRLMEQWGDEGNGDAHQTAGWNQKSAEEGWCSGSSVETRWRLVGEAYIHGIMDGELMKDRKKGKDGKLEGSETFVLI